MKTNNYPTAQSVLYDTCRIVLQNCKKQLVKFMAFSGVYTQEFLDAMVQGVDDAEAMPGEQARSLAHETYRIELSALANDARQLWQGLKRYIAKAYAEELWKANWDAAGWEDYEAASNDNWDKVNAMMVAGSQYIALHSADLTDMPEGYEAEFNAAKEAFGLKFKAFTQAELDAVVGTAKKITANNDVYKQVIEVCEDGQHIFANDEVLKEQFSFTKMSELVKPAGSSTAVITVTNEDGQPMIAEIKVAGTDRVAETDEGGRGEIGQLAAGSTMFIITADGHEQQQITMELKTGTTSHAEVKLEPMFAGTVPENVPAPVNG